MINKICFSIILCICSALAIALPAGQRIAGAYVEADITDPAVIQAANFVVVQINKGSLINIISAKSQVVAGMNYDLQLEIACKDNTHHTFRAVVFVPLPVSGLSMQLGKVQDLGVTKTH